MIAKLRPKIGIQTIKIRTVVLLFLYEIHILILYVLVFLISKAISALTNPDSVLILKILTFRITRLVLTFLNYFFIIICLLFVFQINLNMKHPFWHPTMSAFKLPIRTFYIKEK